MRLLFLRQAREDLAQLHREIAWDNPKAADRTVNRIREGLNRLRDFPLSAPPRDGLARGMRGMAIAGYVAYYRVDESSIRVIRVLHSARDAGVLLDGL